MINEYPHVTVIVPTIPEREVFKRRIIEVFMAQSYERKEIIFGDGKELIGTKRNMLCEQAKGDVIIHFDDDDLYADDWIEHSVKALMESGADITGMSNGAFYDPLIASAWGYKYSTQDTRQYLLGATMCYKKSFWHKNKFQNKQIGEDGFFLWDAKEKPLVHVHDYLHGFLSTIHTGNTCRKPVNNTNNYTRLTPSEVEVLQNRWKRYL